MKLVNNLGLCFHSNCHIKGINVSNLSLLVFERERLSLSFSAFKISIFHATTYRCDLVFPKTIRVFYWKRKFLFFFVFVCLDNTMDPPLENPGYAHGAFLVYNSGSRIIVPACIFLLYSILSVCLSIAMSLCV